MTGLSRRGVIGAITAGALMQSAGFAAAKPKASGVIGALLLPLSGQRAGLGTSLARAGMLALNGGDPTKLLPSFDTLGTAAGAAAAARDALRRSAPPILLGPVTDLETRSALAVAGATPLLSFSNDEALRESGAFLIGITASQLVGAILGYARRRGVRRVTLLAGSDVWGTQCLTAARRSAATTGIALDEPPAGTRLAQLLTPAGNAPDAVLVPSVDQLDRNAADAAKAAGVQLLGLLQSLNYDPATIATLTGAWFAAPDPAAFGDFSARYEAVHGSTPGAIAALAYDAATIARAIGTAGGPVRQALLSPNGFPAVTGALRFRSDGSASRSLAILTVAGGEYQVIDSSTGA